MRKKIAIVGLMLILGLGKLVMAQVWEEIRPLGTGTSPSRPSKRNGHVLIQQFIFGGFGQNNDLWILWQEGDTWRWENMGAQGTAPSPRGGHSGIFASYGLDNFIIIFGGSESFMETLVDTETYKLNEPWNPSSVWQKLETTGTAPSPRAEHTAVYDYSNKMIVFGGYTDPIVASSETYTLDFSVIPASWTKLNTNGEIPARYGHSAIWGYGRMIVFGGKDKSGELLNDCRWFDLGAKSWNQEPLTGNNKPTARWQHTAVWVGGSPGEPGGMLIFGGEDEQGNPLDDVWILQEPGFAEPDWKWEELYPIGDLPSARSGHVAGFVWNGDGGGMFIFGGSDGNGDLNDVYALSRGEKVEQSLQKKPFNVPNPFNPDREETKICYYLDDAESNVKIKLFTLTGDLVYSWENISGRKGMNDESWDGRNEKGRVVENGGYICLIEAGGKKQKCKIAVLR